MDTSKDSTTDEKKSSIEIVEPSFEKTISTKEGQLDEDLDQAELFLREHNFTQAYLQELLEDEQKNKKIIKKVDLLLMPLLCGTYFLQYIDKQALSYAAVFDLFDSTGTTQTQYSWLASIFYFAYLVAEWPASYLAQHYPTGTVISIFTTSWGSVLMLTVACHNFTGLAICRFVLGCLESLVTPCFMLIVGMWYTRKEQPARAGAFYCFNGFGSMMGGILFYAVGQEDNFPVWRVIYILCGGVTVVWGIVLLIFLPNNVITAKRYSIEEKALLIARGQTNRTGIYNRKVKTSQIIEALIDPQVWILFLFVLLNECVNGGIANFGKLIIKGVAGGDSLLTTAYGIPQGGFQVFFVFTGPYLASKFKNIRTYVMALYICPTIIGAALLWNLPRSNKNGLLLAYYIVGSFVSSLVLALQLPANNVAGYTKRVTSTAIVFLAYCIGNIVGPHAFLASEAPIYQTGCKFIIACSAVQIALAFALRALLVRRNAKRDSAAIAAAAAVNGVDGGERGEGDEILEDLTDFQDRKFRYSY